jgi:hypothetical protein
MLKDDRCPQILKFKYNCKSDLLIQIPITMLNNKERKEKKTTDREKHIARKGDSQKRRLTWT